MPSLLTLVLVLSAWGDEPTTRPERAPDRELDGGIVVELLTASEARVAIIDPTDAFFEKLTLLEISLRVDRDLSALPRDEALGEFRKHLVDNVTDWPEEERDTLLAALPKIAEACRAGCPKLVPKRWRFIRTTGRDESNAPYTRGDCIILPAGVVSQFAERSLENLGQLIVHETLHVYTRNHPAERDALYAEVGFLPIPPVTLPESIERIRLTNPDGPGWEHAVTVKDEDSEGECQVIMILTSRIPEFMKAIGGVLPILQFHLYPLTADDPPRLRVDEAGEVVRWWPFTIQSYMEQIGKNTGYIIHPDEILAENLSLLAYPRAGVKSPELLERIRAHFAIEEEAKPVGASSSGSALGG